MPSHSSDDADTRPLRILLVAHTHWDREWYHPAARFRQRLVPLVDALLKGSRADEPFLLDGQAITLVDYLAVRPEREPDLSAALRRGAVEAGPWYVLADNLIPSGEAILRNLEAGRRVLARLGGVAPAVAYCPDSFGHPAALPSIAEGYGLPLAIVWRGLGGASHSSVDTMWWTARDGSRVLVHHLPPAGYETGSALPTAPVLASARWEGLVATLRARNGTGAALLLSGADHHARQPDLHAAIAAARDVLAPAHLVLERTSLALAARRIHAAAVEGESKGHALPTVSGELRDSYGYTWTLQGTFGTRAHQKRANARLERALVCDVEPWMALDFLHGAIADPALDGRIGRHQLPALLAYAWETLLATHPHDTLCGCSVDEVARAMEVTQASVAAQIVGLRRAALENALQHDVVAARTHAPHGSDIVIRNRCGYARGGIAELRIEETVGDVPVGPGSGGDEPAQVGHTRVALPGALVVQHGTRGVVHRRRESPQHYPDDDIVAEDRVVAWVPEIPAFGIRVVGGDGGRNGVEPPMLRPVTALQEQGEIIVSNGVLELIIGRAGLTVRQGGRTLPGAMRLETSRDAGDSYTPSLRGTAQALVLDRVRLGASGPLRASVVLEWTYRERGRADERADVDRHGAHRTGRRRDARVGVRTTLILDAGAGHVRCDIVIDNRMRDHRLQLVWHTDVADAATVRADAAFGHVVRSHAVAPCGAAETPPSTMPLHRWASSTDKGRGAALIADGLAEAEVHGARLAVTLVRSIGELSRADLPERPGHAGWPSPIPAAQCQGRYRATVGLLLHDGWSDATLELIERTSDALLMPLVGESWPDLRSRPGMLPGPTLEGEGLRASAVTLGRDGRALLLRARNLTPVAREGVWVLPDSASWRVTHCRLDETPVGETRSAGSRVAFSVPPHGLTTLRIARADG